jgi:two-component system, LytTR family, response regulator
LNAARIRTVIVDDEPLGRSNLFVLLAQDEEIEVVGQCSSGAEAIQEIRRSKPELVFLDVQMPEVDGFDVLEQLGADQPRVIIFVTAYDQYALRAFEAGALDYLLKPFDNLRFERALSRAKQNIRGAAGSKRGSERLIVKSSGQVVFVRQSEIDWVEAADYYSCLHVGTKAHLLRRSMAELENELDASIFCRIHRSAIVNLSRVRELKLSAEGEYDVVLEDGQKVRLSRRYRAQLQQRLGVLSSSKTTMMRS